MANRQESLKVIIDHLKQQAAACHLSAGTEEKLATLLSDMQNNQYNLVVVGEFKHGKSTFINSLLGRDLLPTDLLPTTAVIHRIYKGDKDELIVHHYHGDDEHLALSPEIMQNYTAGQEKQPDHIKYVDVSLMQSPFDKGTVLVDTPGVNDLNQQRAEIAYDFIPRSDVVLFVLDSGSFLKRTEEEFIREKLLHQDLDKIIFIANFIDRLDEEETDLDELKAEFENRIAHALDLPHPAVYLLSSLLALRGRIEKNDELISYSGILDIEEKIKAMVLNGTRAQEKQSAYIHRAIHLSRQMTDEINTLIVTGKQSVEELAANLKRLDNWEQEKKETVQAIEDYVQLRKGEINRLIAKSINHLEIRLLEEGRQVINQFDGSDVKQLTEKYLPRLSERFFKDWVEAYAPSILELLSKLKHAIEVGLNDYFNSTIQLGAVGGHKLSSEGTITLRVDTGMDSSITSGLIAGGVATGLVAVSLPIFIPLLAMGGFPILRDLMKKNKLGKVKPEIESEWNKLIPETVDQFYESICSQTNELIRNLANDVQNVFDEKVANHRKIIEQMQKESTEKSEKFADREQQLQKAEKELETLETQLQLLLIKKSASEGVEVQ